MSDNESRTMVNSSMILLLVLAAMVVLFGLSFGLGEVGMMGGAMGLGMVLILLPLVLLLWLVLTAADRDERRRPEPPFQPGAYGEYPLQILDRKYANGEMTYQEYATLRDEIVRNHGMEPPEEGH
jgi:uncharacterized membrane protein